MLFKNQFSLFVATFLIIGFFFLALPEKGISGIGPLGCCKIPPGTICTGCGSQDCSILDSECIALGSANQISGGSVCVDGTTCIIPEDTPGCCVLLDGNCDVRVLDDDLEPELGCSTEGIAWFLETDCSEVSQCPQSVVPAVPTLSGWGLMSLAVVLGILGLVGFMVLRRRKVTA